MLGLLLLFLLLPILGIVSLIIYYDNGRPILFRQKRVGLNNTHFWVYKFRTMKNGMPDIPTHLVTSPHLLYTKSGPVLRKWSIDELPQILNIILGEMAFVGPRPALHNQDDLINLRTKFGVHLLKPGVTGWAQVNGRDELSIPEKVEYDRYYLNNASRLLDIKILILTIMRVFGAQGVSH
jgi:O-antigen biosynthesis protein WbqP